MNRANPDPCALSAEFLEALFAEYRADPQSAPEEWRAFFEAFGASRPGAEAGPPRIEPPRLFGRALCDWPRCSRQNQSVALQNHIDQLIRNHRVRGHIMARLDPLGMASPKVPELEPSYYGLTDEDMELSFASGSLGDGRPMQGREILERLRATYCRGIGAQFMHIDNLAIREWLQRRMESTLNRLELAREAQLRILTRLTDATILEEFIQRNFAGAKSFSLEGAESLIPLLDLAIEKAGEHGVREIVLGMPHRGRLNVLANIMGKSPREIFREFEDYEPELHIGRDDVKYHLGYHHDWTTLSGRSIHLALCFNPSHLEYVSPVVLGRVRAKQDRLGDERREQGMAIVIHGDAAFIGEGIVQETLNLSQLEAYTVGGTLHIVVNNQIGFTTNPREGRSSVYATDVARMLQIPIFHVNGEDPEAVAQAVHLAMEFRKAFQRDVVIDMYCYRRRGHNEGDEPMFTQPLMYKAIRERHSVRDGYLEHLLRLGEVTREEADRIAEERKRRLEEELKIVKRREPIPRPKPPSSLGRVWRNYRGGLEKDADEPATGFGKARLAELLERLAQLPEGFRPHPTIARWLESRRQMARGEKPLDWAAAEALAFATLATKGVPIRMTGQDCVRGTFSQRHAAVFDMETGEAYMALRNLDKGQAPVRLHNSPLSEAGVLGFEYGYSMAYPDSLVIWEAQFGDFANCAQVIIDQFLASAEDKWKFLSGLVLLLPHGYEGMGPEHSSARLERFLALCAEDNIQVAVPSTPAQYFHLLRRQMKRRWIKPLVVMSPKSLLRHPRCVSPLEDFAEGRFRRFLPDEGGPAGRAERVLLCAGKIYYELAEEREKRRRFDVAIVRCQQLYPMSDGCMAAALAPYADGTPVYWVQEEPSNMGAWPHLRARFLDRILDRYPFGGICRPASASPATGSANSHKIEQQRVRDRAFAETRETAKKKKSGAPMAL